VNAWRDEQSCDERIGSKDYQCRVPNDLSR
jgi:hypothetical protein